MLRCTGGQVWRVDLDNSMTLHCAWIEWDGTDTGSVLEAFKHLPDECMGSIGMKLISKEKPILYKVRGQEERDTSRSKSLKVESQKSDSKSTRRLFASSTSSDLRLSDHKTFDSPSSTLTFDHTTFTDPAQVGGSSLFRPPLVHSFRAVWIAGLDDADPRAGLGGQSFANLRSIRLNSALYRYRPEHARVIQGAVRGAPTAAAAWQAFEEAMLVDLRMEDGKF